jgi:quercetin dioxygenase-like cupin family protein
MITPGQTLENPVTGERFTFTDTSATTGGELLAFDFALRPGGAVPIPHVHPVQTERFEVVEGRMRFRVGLRTVIAEAGEVIEVAPGVMHSFANAGEEEAHAPFLSVGVQRVLLAPLVALGRRRARKTASEAQSPGGWRTTKPLGDRGSDVQRDPVSLRALVS